MTDNQEKRPTILLADDDETIREHLSGILGRSGLEVKTVTNGAAAIDYLKSREPDLIILDVVMPIMDGREALRQIRERHEWLPVILLTQIGESFERAEALNEGADDYLNKPFDPHELLARIKAVLRRSSRGQKPISMSQILQSNGIKIDRVARRIFVNSKEMQLTPRAFALLEYLMAHPQEAFSRDRLLKEVWGFDSPITTRAVDHRIAEIRKLLAAGGIEAGVIETVPQFGYRFEGQVEQA